MFSDLTDLSSLLTHPTPSVKEKKQLPTTILAKKSTNSKDIWDLDEVDEQEIVAVDPRPNAEYDIQYQQQLNSEDIFLGVGGRTNTIADADSLIVTIKLPGVAAMNDITLDCKGSKLSIRCPLFKLDAELGHQVDDKRGSADWDSKKCNLKVTLPINKSI
jgi:hypothetical protein